MLCGECCATARYVCHGMYVCTDGLMVELMDVSKMMMGVCMILVMVYVR